MADKMKNQNDKKIRKPKKKHWELRRCPRCGKRSLETIKIYKKNWFFGKKSKPRKYLQKTVRRCLKCGWREEDIK